MRLECDNISLEVNGNKVGIIIEPAKANKGARFEDIVALIETVDDIEIIKGLPEEATSLLYWVKQRLRDIRDAYY